MNDINEDILFNQKEQLINEKADELIRNNPKILLDNKILEIEYNVDGTKKDLYSLSSEKDIREMQIKSDLNEIEFKFNQNQISKEEYQKSVKEKNNELNELKLIYNDLIFGIINSNDLDKIKASITEHNLNEIDLKRLKDAITDVTNFKIDEFTENNKKFMIDKISYWNYKYNELSKAISKSREVENFILDLIK